MDAAADDVAFRPAWRLDDPQIVRDVKHLWSLTKISPSMAEKRAGEICAVAYSGEALVAVSTAKITWDATMRNKFFSYRCMVAPQFRQHDMAWKISAYSLKLLQEWNTKNSENALGLMICIETDKFEAGLRRPVREKFGFTMHFAGYTRAGQQLRIVWFDDAMLDDSAGNQNALPAGQMQSG